MSVLWFLIFLEKGLLWLSINKRIVINHCLAKIVYEAAIFQRFFLSENKGKYPPRLELTEAKERSYCVDRSWGSKDIL
jgi:hypothetical protein